MKHSSKLPHHTERQPRAAGLSSAGKLLLTAIAALGPITGYTQSTFTESFTGTSAPGWVFGANPGDAKPFLTAATGASGYDGSGNAIGAPIDTSGDGWLRLNNNTGNQSTFALLDTQIFSVNARIEIQMEYAFWNGSGADGITFFLVDGNINSSTFVPGAYGGSMGYAQRTGEAGMPGGYLGFALDNFGNYSNGSEGRNGGVTLDGTLYPNRVSVRGPESSNFEYIASNSSALAGQMDFPSYTTRPDQSGVDYRAFKIVLDANNQLTVEMKFGASGSFTTAFTADLSAYERPDNFKIGFTGATGASTELHEIRNLSLTTSPWATGSGAYEWDNGAGTTTWGTLAGGEANTNWYSTEPADTDKTPIRDSDVLFGNKPTTNPNNTQSVQLGNNVEVRNLTFDSNINYQIGTVGAGRTITFGDTGKVGLPSINVNDYNGAYALHKINADISLAEKLAIRNFSYSTLCLNGTFETNGNDVTVSGFGAVNFNGDISGSGDLIKNGSGITTINNDNSNDPDGGGALTAWSGNVTVNDGMLVVTSTGALGNTTGTTTVNSGGTLAFRNNVTYATTEAITISGSGITRNTGQLAGAIHNDGGNNSFAGTVTLAADSAIGSRAGNLTLSGVVSDGASTFGLTKVGEGIVTLSNTGNNYNGTTTIAGGALRITGGEAALAGGFSTGGYTGGGLTLNGGVLEIGVATTFTRSLGTTNDQVQFTGDGGFSASGANRTVNLGGAAATVTWGSGSFVPTGNALLLGSSSADYTLTFSNPIALGSAVREIRVADGTNNSTGATDATLSGAISGSGGINKTGTGTLLLSVNNSYTGETRISGGALRVDNTNRINGTNLVLNGGVLESGFGTFNRNLGTGADQVQWTGDGGFAAAGANRAVQLNAGTGSVTWGTTGSFIGASNALILGSTSSGFTVTFDNALNLGASGTRTIRTVAGTASLATTPTAGFTAATAIISGAANLEVTGNGRLDLAANNTQTGSVTVTGAQLRINGASGDLAQSSGFTVRQGGNLVLDNSGSNNADRIGAVGIDLQGGTFTYNGNTAASSTETVGALTLGSGANTLDIVNNFATGFAQLTVASLTRSAGSTIDFTNSTATNGTFGTGNTPRLIFGTTLPTLDDGILAHSTVNGANFATLSGSNLIAQTTYDTGAQTGWTATTDNAAPAADVTAANALSAARTINSLKLGSGIDVDQAGFTLTLQSGGLLTTGATAATITGGSLTTGNSNELIVHAYNTGGTTISSTLTGSGGLTKSGTGTLTLSGTAANTLTGLTTVNAGTLVLDKSDNITAIAGNLTIGDGRGIDTVRLDSNEQIADTAVVTLRGGEVGNSANVARLELNGAASNTDPSRVETFNTLTITGNSVLDFGGGSVCSPTFLRLDYLTVAANSLLTITNWIEFTDFLLVEKATFDESQLARIIFDGYPGTARFTDYDGTYWQITPVPEPSAYGALALAGLAGFYATRRRRRPA